MKTGLFTGVIALAVIQHFFWGVLLLLDERTAWITALHTSSVIYEWLLGVSHSFAIQIDGIVLLSVSLLAFWGMVHTDGPRLRDALYIIPQQLILIMSAVGACTAIYMSQFADGVIRPRAFIAADQGRDVILGVIHTIALWQLHGRPLWRRLL